MASNYTSPGADFQSADSILGADSLIIGSDDQLAEVVTIASGQGVVARGTVVGIVTASGKYAVSASAASDGSQNMVGIVLDTVDATSADAQTQVAYAGRFNGNALILGTGMTLAAVKAAGRLRSIFIESAMG